MGDHISQVDHVRPFHSKSDEESEAKSDENGVSVPMPESEPVRLSILRECDILYSDPYDADFDRYTSLCTRMFNVPICVVSLVDADCVWFKSKFGLDIQKLDRDHFFCSYAVLPDAPDVTVVLNAPNDSKFARNPLVCDQPKVRFYAGAVLKVEGARIGTLALMDTVPHESFSLVDQQNLLGLADVISRIISSRRLRFLRDHRSQCQHILSFTHNLRTPCTALEISVKSLTAVEQEDQEQHLFSALTAQDLTTQTDHLVQMVSYLTDLSNLMPNISDSASMQYVTTNGYNCDLVRILSKLQTIYASICQTTSLKTTIDPLLMKDHLYYDSFPEMFAISSLALVRTFANFSSGVTVNVHFFDKKDIEELDEDISAGLEIASSSSHSSKKGNGVCRPGVIVFDIHSEVSDKGRDQLLHRSESFRCREEQLKALGGGFTYKITAPHQNYLGHSSEERLYYRFWLPMFISSSPPATLDQNVSRSRSLTPPLKQKVKVLVMDDDESSRKRLKEVLCRLCHCQVHTVSNGLQGLKEFQRAVESEVDQAYDFVFIDLLMPVMHGGTVMHNIAQWERQRLAAGHSPLHSVFIEMRCEDDDSVYLVDTTRRCASSFDEASLSPSESDGHHITIGSQSKDHVTASFTHVVKKPIDANAVASILSAHLAIDEAGVLASDSTKSDAQRGRVQSKFGQLLGFFKSSKSQKSTDHKNKKTVPSKSLPYLQQMPLLREADGDTDSTQEVSSVGKLIKWFHKAIRFNSRNDERKVAPMPT